MPKWILEHKWSLPICVALAALTWAAYRPILSYSFVYWDDDAHVYDNYYVKNGLTKEGFLWSVTPHGPSQWHPLAWWSHQLDSQWYGGEEKDGARHHRTNLILHIAAAVCLYFALRRLTGSVWASASVAGFFAVHPLTVESVAWIAERRDVLMAVFFALTLWAYAAYAQHRMPQRPVLGPIVVVLRYLLILVVFALGLMSKPMLVTTPCVLLLLDYWPLRRIKELTRVGWPAGRETPAATPWPIGLLILEKIPLLGMSIASVVLSYMCESAIWDHNRYSLRFQLANAANSYVMYLLNVAWPTKLSPMYQLPQEYPVSQIAAASAVLLAITAVAIYFARSRPYLIVGWLWYLGMLVPVIGLHRVGVELARADHWAYLPLIGIYIAVVWGVRDLVLAWRIPQVAVGVLTCVLLVTCACLTHRQAMYWKDTITLFGRVLELNPNLAEAHNNMAVALNRRGDKQESSLDRQRDKDDSLRRFRIAVELRKNYFDAWNNLGVALLERGEVDGPIRCFSTAIAIKPDYADGHFNLANVLLRLKRTDEAIYHYEQALRYNPLYVAAYNRLGNIYMVRDQYPQAVDLYSRALHYDPKYLEARINLGLALARMGRIEQAAEQFREALKGHPNDPTIREYLRRADEMLQGQGIPRQ